MGAWKGDKRGGSRKKRIMEAGESSTDSLENTCGPILVWNMPGLRLDGDKVCGRCRNASSASINAKRLSAMPTMYSLQYPPMTRVWPNAGEHRYKYANGYFVRPAPVEDILPLCRESIEALNLKTGSWTIASPSLYTCRHKLAILMPELNPLNSAPVCVWFFHLSLFF